MPPFCVISRLFSLPRALAGFKGQSRVIFPTISSCYECSLDMLNKPTAFPICTIANTPRLPEHCIEWASVLEWPKVHGGTVNHLLQENDESDELLGPSR